MSSSGKEESWQLRPTSDPHEDSEDTVMFHDVSGGFGRKISSPVSDNGCHGWDSTTLHQFSSRKVPDEDPLPCGGTEKLRDEKFLARVRGQAVQREVEK